MKRVRRRQPKPAETYVVHGPQGIIFESAYHGVALTAAQEFALRQATGPVSLLVERRSLFGPAEPLHRVERDGAGSVRTFRCQEAA